MRMVAVLLCAALAPAVLRAQAPAPASVSDPAMVAAAALARMSSLAIMIAGGLMEGYGYTLYHGGK